MVSRGIFHNWWGGRSSPLSLLENILFVVVFSITLHYICCLYLFNVTRSTPFLNTQDQSARTFVNISCWARGIEY